MSKTPRTGGQKSARTTSSDKQDTEQKQLEQEKQPQKEPEVKTQTTKTDKDKEKSTRNKKSPTQSDSPRVQKSKQSSSDSKQEKDQKQHADKKQEQKDEPEVKPQTKTDKEKEKQTQDKKSRMKSDSPRAGKKSPDKQGQQKPQQQEPKTEPGTETETKPEDKEKDESTPTKEHRKSTAGSASPRKSQQQKRSPNKIYRTPPTPDPEDLHIRERSFILDSIAVNTTSKDYSQVKPKLGQIIPPYNAQLDKSTQPYFDLEVVKKTTRRTGQGFPGTSIEGPVIDRCSKTYAGYQYITLRNLSGAGHSRDTIDGHGQFMTGLPRIRGYNGDFGYRRNNPWLRKEPSSFGLIDDTRSPPHNSARA